MNWLQRKRTANALRSSTQQQAMLDSAPVGSVGAPGGLLGAAPTQAKPFGLGGLLAAGSAIPGVGDAVGLLGDAAMYASDPKSRTWGNALMTGLGALPFVPSAQQLAELAGPLSAMVVYHGSPHKFGAFDLSKVGTGEGAQAYGHGLYFAESPDVAGQYAETLARSHAAQKFASDAQGLSPAAKKFLRERLDVGVTKEQLAKEAHVAKAQALSWDAQDARRGLKPTRDYYASAMDEVIAHLSRSNLPEMNRGSLYTVDLPDEAIAKMLDWDKPLSDQAPEVRNTLRSLVDDVASSPNAARASRDIARAFNPYSRADLLEEISKRYGWKIDGNNLVKPDGTVIPESAIEAQLKMRQRGKVYDSAGDLYRDLAQAQGSDAAISAALRNNGIPGIRYLDGGSRSGGKGTSNFVVFDDKLPKILKRE